MSTDSLLDKMKNGSLFGYVPGGSIVPDELKPTFSNFPPKFQKNTDVCRNDIGEYMKKIAEENDLLKNLQRILILSFKIEKGTTITFLFKSKSWTSMYKKLSVC